jgi:hypothetical protein
MPTVVRIHSSPIFRSALAQGLRPSLPMVAHPFIFLCEFRSTALLVSRTRDNNTGAPNFLRKCYHFESGRSASTSLSANPLLTNSSLFLLFLFFIKNYTGVQSFGGVFFLLEMNHASKNYKASFKFVSGMINFNLKTSFKFLTSSGNKKKFIVDLD